MFVMEMLMVLNNMIDDCTVVILAGGESKRMGQDKASLKLANDSLLNRAITNLQPLFENMIISVKKPNEKLLIPQLCDQGVGGGPIMGVVTAMQEINTAWLFVMACDMPFVSLDLIKAMAARRGDGMGDRKQVIIPVVGGMMQPLCAFYATSCLPILQTQIDKGERSLKRAIGNLDTTCFSEKECMTYDPKLLSFFDLDTMDDVAQAESVLKKG